MAANSIVNSLLKTCVTHVKALRKQQHFRFQNVNKNKHTHTKPKNNPENKQTPKHALHATALVSSRTGLYRKTELV